MIFQKLLRDVPTDASGTLRGLVKVGDYYRISRHDPAQDAIAPHTS